MKVLVKKVRMKTLKMIKNFVLDILRVLSVILLLLLYLLLNFAFILPAFISHKWGSQKLSLKLADMMIFLKDLIVSILE